jgi:hypothetical protein
MRSSSSKTKKKLTPKLKPSMGNIQFTTTKSCTAQAGSISPLAGNKAPGEMAVTGMQQQLTGKKPEQ